MRQKPMEQMFCFFFLDELCDHIFLLATELACSVAVGKQALPPTVTTDRLNTVVQFIGQPPD